MQPRVPRLDWIETVLAEPHRREGRTDPLPLAPAAQAPFADGQGLPPPKAFAQAARRRRAAAKRSGKAR